MDTTHEVVCGNAQRLEAIADASVELVVTSPPYPLVEMWDEAFASQSQVVGSALRAGDGEETFEGMHRVLDEVWSEVERVLVDGGIACVNIGDATRTIGGDFQVYPNHARIIDAFQDRGFNVLPDILWRKPTNSMAKFMGSGMRPPNAYVTLEHEYILVFRKGSLRQPHPENRDSSAYFWEERNTWFSDVWTDVNGVSQTLEDEDSRERSGAYPFDIPHRLINMFSVRGDTVFDPFLGTGTTTLAAICAGRNSIGYELDSTLLEAVSDRVSGAEEVATTVSHQRLANHREFVAESDREFKYEADYYDFPVTTRGEQGIQFLEIESIQETDTGFTVEHKSVE